MAPGRALNGSRGNMASSVSRIWATTNAPDYVGFLVLLVLYILLVTLVQPFHRMFFINDLNISFPHAEHERVTVLMNFVYALFIPLGILIFWNIAARSPRQKHEATYLSFAISIILTTFITDVIKNAVGRPRPDLLDRCQPAPDTPSNALVTIDVCTTTLNSHLLQDGWRSFPSGHSSFSFAGLGFLSLFLAGQLHVFRTATPGGRDLSRALLCLAPLLGAAMVAISRCEDYRHDVYDVCVGSALGMTVTYWSYRRHWPALSSPRCHEPHPQTAQEGAGSGGVGWERVRDEEEAVGDVGFELGRGVRND